MALPENNNTQDTGTRPDSKANHCYWKARSGSLTPIRYWNVVTPDGEAYIEVEFTFMNETGDIEQSYRLFDPESCENLVEIASLEYV